MADIKIAGAGLGGLSAAINLAQAGISTEVFEMNKDCGCRFHGDLQGIENWSYEEDALMHLKNMNLKIGFGYKPVKSVKITNFKESAVVSANRPGFYLLKRGPEKGTLDQSLKEQALSCGVRINFSKKIPESSADIIATGPLGRKVFGADYGIVFKAEMDDVYEMLLDDSVAYRGYSYFLVVDGYACLCTVLFDKFKDVNACFKKTKDFFVKKYNLIIKNEKTVGGVGHFSLRPTFVKGTSMLVGESAGIQDMLFGFGIRSSLYSGYLAAQSIISHKDYAEKYDIAAKKAFSNKIKASFVNRFFWNRLGSDYGMVIRRLKKTKDPLHLIRKVYDYTLFHRVCYPFLSMTERL